MFACNFTLIVKDSKCDFKFLEFSRISIVYWSYCDISAHITVVFIVIKAEGRCNPVFKSCSYY